MQILSILITVKKTAFILIIFLFPGLAFLGNSTGNRADHKTIITIPEVALLAVHSAITDETEIKSIAKNVAADNIYFNQTIQADCWINYSSVLNRNHHRKITATVSGEILSGMILKINVSDCRGNSIGNVGQGLQQVTLSNSPTEIVSGIGSGFKGTGAFNGHHITYDIEMKDAESYAVSSKINTSVYVIFTLSDDN